MPSLLVLSHVQGHTTHMGFQKRSLVDALGREQTWNILCSHTCWTQLDFALSQQLYTCNLRRGSRTNMDDWTAKTLAHAWVCTYCLEHNAIMLPQDLCRALTGSAAACVRPPRRLLRLFGWGLLAGGFIKVVSKGLGL